MLTVQIQEVHRQYRIRESQASLKSHLDQLTETLISELLEQALERHGVAPSDELCIRRLELSLSYSNRRVGGAWLADWAEELADVLAVELARGDNSRIVRYRSRVEAYVDVARSMIDRNWQRAWAWRTLGITESRGSDLPQIAKEWHASLLREPQLVVHMRALMTAGLVAELLSRTPLEIGDVEMIAHTAMAQIDRRVARSSDLSVPETGKRRATSSSDLPFADPIVGRVVEYADRNGSLPTTALRSPPLVIWWLAAIEPGLLILPQQTIDRVVLGVSHLLRQEAEPESGASQGALATLDAAASTPMSISDTDASPWTHESPRPQTAQANGLSQVTADKARPALSDEPPARTAEELCRADEPVLSDHGGLLMLVNLVPHYNFVEALYANPERPLGWSVEQIMQRLIGLPVDDPALAVLSGRSPDEKPWREREALITDGEADLLDAVAKKMAAKLTALLPEVPPEDVVELVCARHARLEMSAGWLTAVFNLGDADPRLRRCGLDLNPNHVPWLGRVVRFEYE